MENSYIAAYDFGTSSVKAVLMDTEGSLYASATAAYPIYEPKISFVEQDPEEYWQAIIASTKDVLEKSQIKKEDVKAVVFSTQAMGIIPVGEDGRTLHRNISWIDGRGGKEAVEVNELVGAEIVGAKDVIPKLLWIKKNEPEIYNKTKYFLNVNGYLLYRTTGRFVSELSGAASYGIDIQKNQWLFELYDAIGIDTGKLPPIINSTDKVGNLTKEAAQWMGLTTDTEVYGGCDDVQAAVLGSGCSSNGEAHIYLGSSAWYCPVTDKYFDAKNGGVTTKSADPKLNVMPGVTQSACMTADWAMSTLYKDKRDEVEDIYRFVENEVKDIPAGSENLLSTPWIYGEYCPIKSETVRGSFFNLSNIHNRAHIMRAVYEGICYNLRLTMENYVTDFGIQVEDITVIGGGTRSETWMQMFSDVLGMNVKTIKDDRYAGALGGGICAAIGMGRYPDFESTKKMITQDRIYRPQKSNTLIYDRLFAEYKNYYVATKEIFERLNG